MRERLMFTAVSRSPDQTIATWPPVLKYGGRFFASAMLCTLCITQSKPIINPFP